MISKETVVGAGLLGAGVAVVALLMWGQMDADKQTLTAKHDLMTAQVLQAHAAAMGNAPALEVADADVAAARARYLAKRDAADVQQKRTDVQREAILAAERKKLEGSPQPNGSVATLDDALAKITQSK